MSEKAPLRYGDIKGPAKEAIKPSIPTETPNAIARGKKRKRDESQQKLPTDRTIPYKTPPTIPKAQAEIVSQPKAPKVNGYTNGVKKLANGHNPQGPKKAWNSDNRDRGNPQNGVSPHGNFKKTRETLLISRQSLPIWSHANEIRQSLRDSKDVLLLTGETGSGKSTQVPQFLVNEPWCTGCIAITQPRRMAAISLARRVAEEMGYPLGSRSLTSKVGYSVRFDTSTSPGMKIKFLTEGMLLQEMLSDPSLKKYSAVVVDEVHERSVNVDLLLGFLRNLVLGDKKGRGGRPLKVVVMSATQDTEALWRFFDAGFTKSGIQMPKAPKQTNGNSEKLEDSDSSWAGISSGDEKAVRKRKLGKPNGALKENGKPLTNGATKKEPTPEPIQVFSDHMSICYVKGRQHPVKISYLPEPTQDFVESALKAIFQIHTKEPLPGDVLVFLTGQEAVESLEKLVNDFAPGMDENIPKVSGYISKFQFLANLIWYFVLSVNSLYHDESGVVLCLVKGIGYFWHSKVTQADRTKILVLPLFAALPQAAQQRIFERTPDRTRKVIIATNIAETSVTVPGVRYVIDGGKVKIKQFRHRLGLESLLVKPISQSAAIQRKGRAGREAAGHCYRLYTEKDYLGLDPRTLPEILRSDLSHSLLTMKARGIDDVLGFPFLDPPPRESLEKALLQLLHLGALTETGQISDIGLKIARLPLTPVLGRAVLEAAAPERDCLVDVIDIIACLSVENVFIDLNFLTEEKREEAESARQYLRRREGDHMTYLATVQAFAAEHADRKAWTQKHFVSHRTMQNVMDIRKQLRQQCIQMKLLSASADLNAPPAPSEARTNAILHSLLRGFASNTARLMPDGSYRTMIGNQTVAIHPSSVLFGKKVEAIVFSDFVFTTKSFARGVSAVQLDWVSDVIANL
ncbi:P-loop containing nucleoside triphosphate hydrolase protein [Lophium mytilinum]|uniref:RNA helicase n=1 Tax=Lophium mytilinum TaxID=390894 RepID=A0A6A6RB42_9PEZI|nr:P-loop containing nucleoside triphosphate hydrolase protein [Lophium mytilinum]